MHDLGYVIAGYALTAATLLGYRWRLAVRSRHAQQLLTALTGRPAPRRQRP